VRSRGVRMGLLVGGDESVAIAGDPDFTRPILLDAPRTFLAAGATVSWSGLAWGLPVALAFQVLRRALPRRYSLAAAAAGGDRAAVLWERRRSIMP